jgi:hypothetical protein
VTAALALALTALGARGVSAQTAATPAPATPTPAAPAAVVPVPEKAPNDLQSPEQASTRYSAYTLPAHMVSFESGALGIGGGDVVALMGISYGLGAGFQINANLAHFAVGMFNLGVGYHFIDTRYFDLGAKLGAWYGHGKWYWIATPAAEKLISKIDVVALPIELTATSTPARWLEVDLSVAYAWASFFGSAPSERSPFADNEIGLRQFFLRPGVRFFLADHTAFEVSTKLPLYTAIPLEDRTPEVRFKRAWAVEGGFRSRFARGLFGSIRLHYGSISDALYGARVYPSFEIELRR